MLATVLCSWRLFVLSLLLTGDNHLTYAMIIMFAAASKIMARFELLLLRWAFRIVYLPNEKVVAMARKPLDVTEGHTHAETPTSTASPAGTPTTVLPRKSGHVVYPKSRCRITMVSGYLG